MDPMEQLIDKLVQSSILSCELYYPNMCHICRCFGENAINLKRCGACQMISYCSKEHQTQDWPNHKQFCKVICQIKEEWKIDSIFQPLKKMAAKMSSGTCENLKEELKSHAELTDFLKFSIQRRLKRELRQIEQQMIEFPRVCAVCCESKSQLLTNCKNCPLSSFCKEHLNDPGHETECTKILSSFSYTTKKDDIVDTFMFFFSVLDKKGYITFSDPEIKKLPSSMSEFIETHFLQVLAESDISKTAIRAEMKLFNATLAERFSRPFTLLFAIEKLRLTLNSMVIHVVGASDLEIMLTDWEIVLHFLPELRQLRLVLIGPELWFKSREQKQVCSVCKKEGKKLIVETIKELYHEYCGGNDFLKPDMIVSFNPGFYIYDSWEKSMQSFGNGQCPLLVTSLHATEGLIDKGLIDSAFPSAKCIYNDYNPFPCARYQRESTFLPLAARNQFMFLYEFLDGKMQSN